MTAAAVCPDNGGSCPHQGCSLLAEHGGQRLRLALNWSKRYCQSAQRSADRSVRRLIPRRHRTAPALRWAARHCAGPPGECTRARTDAAPVPPPPPPRGRTRKAPAPLRSARAAASSPPYIPPRGLCGSLLLLEVGGCAASAGGLWHRCRAALGCLPRQGLRVPRGRDARPASVPLLPFLPPWKARNVMPPGSCVKASALRSAAGGAAPQP